MKISKVNHVRTAVGNIDQKNPEGFLYQDPNRKRRSISASQRFEELNRTAGRLYSVVGPIRPMDQRDNDKREIDKSSSGLIKSTVTAALIRKYFGGPGSPQRMQRSWLEIRQIQ